LRIDGSGFLVQGSGFGVRSVGPKVWRSEFRI
jgi:hypothetical protein